MFLHVLDLNNRSNKYSNSVLVDHLVFTACLCTFFLRCYLVAKEFVEGRIRQVRMTTSENSYHKNVILGRNYLTYVVHICKFGILWHP